MTKLLRAGAVSGAAGGVALAAVLLLFGEGPIGTAVSREGAHTHEELFSRGTQQAGGALVAVLFGVAVGLVFSVVFASTRHRLGLGTDTSRSLAVAAAGFVSVTLVPFVLYPPNPPGVGGGASVGVRTWAYLTAMGWSVVALVAAVKVARGLRRRGVAQQPALVAGAVAHLVLVLVAALALPDRVPAEDLPAELVWDLRLASLLGAAALWGTVGLVFPWAAAAALRGATREAVGAGA